MDAFAFLKLAAPAKPESVYVLAGDERFLKQAALRRIQELVLGPAADDFGRSEFDGESADYAAVQDELLTLPFLAPRRLVLIQDADAFVTEHRKRLEKYVAAPSGTGVLVLDVHTWPSTTNLAKATVKSTVHCGALKGVELAGWCRDQATRVHGKQLTPDAAQLLGELSGPELGVLDQELAKLAAYVGARDTIAAEDVDRLVGHSRIEDVWKMLDAAANGNAAQALTLLGQLMDQGEEPVGVLGAMSWQLRQAAQVARLHKLGTPLPAAMNQAGVKPFGQRRLESQLKLLGPKTEKLLDWLVEADLEMKTTDGLPRPLLLERLLIRLLPANARK